MSAAPALRVRPSAGEIGGAIASGALATAGAIAVPFVLVAEPEPGVRPLSSADAVWWVVLAVVLLQAAALLWAKRLPGPVLGAVTLAPMAHALLFPGVTYSLTTVAVSFGVFWAVLGLTTRRLAIALSAVVVAIAAAQVVNDIRGGAPADLGTILLAALQAVVVVAIPLVIALFVAARRDARASRAAELAALERERDALVQAAVSRERMAMSRELHDVAAHHMSGIALLAAAIARQVDVDPAAAKVAAQRVREQSTTALDDLRRVIGLLREEDDGGLTAEALASIRDLVDLRRAAGTDVAYRVHSGAGELGWGIGPLAQLVAYRMVQEALANVTAHAPGANVVVELDDRDAAALALRVSNDGAHAPDPGPGSGFGLVGMRERAALVGGDLEYGATPDGGWDVRLRLTRDPPLDRPGDLS